MNTNKTQQDMIKEIVREISTNKMLLEFVYQIVIGYITG